MAWFFGMHPSMHEVWNENNSCIATASNTCFNHFPSREMRHCMNMKLVHVYIVYMWPGEQQKRKLELLSLLVTTATTKRHKPALCGTLGTGKQVKQSRVSFFRFLPRLKLDSEEMGDEIDASILQRTQQKLGKYIQRPQLTDKLLKRPPFRFLHDIVTTVRRSFKLIDSWINSFLCLLCERSSGH